MARIKVRAYLVPFQKERADGIKLVKYKILEIEDFELNANWKIPKVGRDFDKDSKVEGAWYLTEEELDRLRDLVQVEEIVYDNSAGDSGTAFPV